MGGAVFPDQSGPQGRYNLHSFNACATTAAKRPGASWKPDPTDFHIALSAGTRFDPDQCAIASPKCVRP